jgi:hypothetical protein
MKSTVRIKALSQQLLVMIAFNKNKVGIKKIFKNTIPFTKICDYDNFLILTVNLKSVGWLARVVANLKRFD